MASALRGFSSQNDQGMAFDSGTDIFMANPVRFRDVGRILEDQVKSRGGGQVVELVGWIRGGNLGAMDTV